MEASKDNLKSPSTTVNGTDDREARSKFWIAAYTRPKSEIKAASELKKDPHTSINTYVATQTEIRKWSDRKKKIETVVIPMVIFAEVSTDEEILEVKKHRLVRKVLTFPGKKEPARIPRKQIEQLQLMLRESEEPVEFVEGYFKVDDKVKVVGGKLAGLEGVVAKATDGNTKLTVVIDILGGASTTINPANLERIDD